MTSQLDLSRPQPLLPLRSDFKVTFYDRARLDRYRGAVLQVLEHTGVRFASPKALAILEEHGATVDRASAVVRFAPELVARALASAPRTFWLGSRDGDLDLDPFRSASRRCDQDRGRDQLRQETGLGQGRRGDG